jgi:hypothetical protein
MIRPLVFVRALLSLAVLSPAAGFGAAIGHHGGMILHCTAPVFFEESPGKEAKVARLDRFSFTASDNTDPQTLKVWLNAQPLPVQVETQRSGRHTVTAELPDPLTQGRAWIKATGTSHDGCDQLQTWNVYVNP